MKESRLPKDLVELGQAHGLAGKRVYIPKQKLHTLVTRYKPAVLQEMETTYEDRGLTFYDEPLSRRTFSGMFGKGRVAFRYGLKPRTAASVSAAAWKAWREWFGHKERPRLERLRTLAEENGCEYSALFFSYLKIRGQIRSCGRVDIRDYTGYHAVSAEAIRQVVDLARLSIESCPWRNS